jgi:hypothetical protein
LHRIAERNVGPIGDRRHSFGETGPLISLLTEAGFRDVQSKTVTRIRFEDSSVFVRLNATALVGMSPTSKEMSDKDREQTIAAIARDSADVVRTHSDEATGFTFELSSNVATARRD